MTYDETMAQLKALSNEAVLKQNAKRGAGDNQFGVTTGDIRKLASRIKTNPELAEALWKSGNIDAMMLATLLMQPKQLSVKDLDRLVGSVTYEHVADYLSTNVVKLHPEREAQRERWMNSKHDFTARMGWSLTAGRIIKSPEGLDILGLLDRIEAEMVGAPPAKQWTMNYSLAEIGINFPKHRARAIAIGEKLGVLRDYPVSKGCVSPFAPNWITEMVRRKG
jgi:3-methyladenine DNA glycosylase AlkD